MVSGFGDPRVRPWFGMVQPSNVCYLKLLKTFSEEGGFAGRGGRTLKLRGLVRSVIY
jgi:hypothetical protein